MKIRILFLFIVLQWTVSAQQGPPLQLFAGNQGILDFTLGYPRFLPDQWFGAPCNSILWNERGLIRVFNYPNNLFDSSFSPIPNGTYPNANSIAPISILGSYTSSIMIDLTANKSLIFKPKNGSLSPGPDYYYTSTTTIDRKNIVVLSKENIVGKMIGSMYSGASNTNNFTERSNNIHLIARPLSSLYYGWIQDSTLQVPFPLLRQFRSRIFSIDTNGTVKTFGSFISSYFHGSNRFNIDGNLMLSVAIARRTSSTLDLNTGIYIQGVPYTSYVCVSAFRPEDTLFTPQIFIRKPRDPTHNLAWPIDTVPFYSSWGTLDLILSPNNRYLYHIMQQFDRRTRLVRYDLSLQDTALIYQNTEVLLDVPASNTSNGWFPMAFQYGPDLKIYVAIDKSGSQTTSYLGCIEYPDSSVHGFDPFFLSKGNRSFRFFSNYVASFLYKGGFSVRHFCRDSVAFRTRYTAMLDSVRWDFGDPASGASNSSSLLHPSHSYSTHGKFFVQWKGYQYGYASEWTDTVLVLPVPEVKLPADTLLCTDDMLLLEVQQGFPASYLWQDGSTDSVYLATTPGTYWVQISSDSCGSVSDTLVLRYTQKPEISLRDTLLCEEDFTVLSVSAPLAQYQWNTGSTDSSIYASQMGLYSVIASNPCGADTAFARIETRPCDCKLYIPQAFTPDGNGKNEQFSIVSNCSDMRWELIVYNRWGEPIAQLNQENAFWNGQNKGQAVPPGVYQYSLRYHFPESQPVGYSFDKVHYGEISLIR